ncbi:MAG: ABC transporter permease [Gammaproteobacteria bacterium]|nr:ABC transporter permease [Gammaproteobacteria bacterium]
MEARKVSNLRGFWVILRKEVIDNLRDRRTLTTMAISILVGPLVLFGFLWFIEKTIKDGTDLVDNEAIELPVMGAEYAPNLMNWLVQNNIEIFDAPADPDEAIKNKDHQMVLVIDEAFPEAFSSGKTAPLRLIHDSSVSQLEKIQYQIVRQVINGYSSQVGTMRLVARGVDPQIVRVIAVNDSDVAKPQARGAMMLSILPYLFITFIMVGGMYLATDTTAGEREKGSLEPLLTQPVSRPFIVLAKLGATVVFSGLTLLFVMSGLAIGFKYLPIDAITFSVSATAVLTVFIGCLPFVLVACAAMVLIASFAKSYKETQSYLGVVMMVPSLPLMLLMFMSPLPSVDNMWIPSLSQALVIIETFKGEMIPLNLFVLSMVSSTLLAALLAFIAIKLYQQERILG